MRQVRCTPSEKPLRVESKSDAGTVTAEFALTLPIVIAVLAVVLGALALSTQRVLIASLAAEIARYEARGDTQKAAQQLSRVPRGASVKRHDVGALHCVTVVAGLSSGPLQALQVSAKSCAMKTSVEGRL